ncbi:tautomerase family protein [Dyella halodurans]|uniref:Tautomerase family protein n=1 Tax=Dyella halodurans TaxID=1920171 RepID=A0ABV9C220_9GAMM|nr:tautomerase family protein [Dyella halodurans]
MPLIRIDVLEGRSTSELQALCDQIHLAMVEAFGVPLRDRYQLVHQHRADTIYVEDTGLGYARSTAVVVISVTSRPRPREAKVRFYRLVSDRLQRYCGVAAEDTVISITTNQDEDWSFGLGRAQFLTGELSVGHAAR